MTFLLIFAAERRKTLPTVFSENLFSITFYSWKFQLLL